MLRIAPHESRSSRGDAHCLRECTGVARRREDLLCDLRTADLDRALGHPAPRSGEGPAPPSSTSISSASRHPAVHCQRARQRVGRCLRGMRLRASGPPPRVPTCSREQRGEALRGAPPQRRAARAPPRRSAPTALRWTSPTFEAPGIGPASRRQAIEGRRRAPVHRGDDVGHGRVEHRLADDRMAKGGSPRRWSRAAPRERRRRARRSTRVVGLGDLDHQRRFEVADDGAGDDHRPVLRVESPQHAVDELADRPRYGGVAIAPRGRWPSCTSTVPREHPRARPPRRGAGPRRCGRRCHGRAPQADTHRGVQRRGPRRRSDRAASRSTTAAIPPVPTPSRELVHDNDSAGPRRANGRDYAGITASSDRRIALDYATSAACISSSSDRATARAGDARDRPRDALRTRRSGLRPSSWIESSGKGRSGRRGRPDERGIGAASCPTRPGRSASVTH